MRNKIFALFLTGLMGCMKLPEQPPLTSYEEAYFAELTQECNCKVEREIDPSTSKNREQFKNSGYYLIELGGIPCHALTNKDSLGKVSKEIAKKLHHNILGKHFNYFYKEITISYFCDTTPNGHISQYFDYKIDELAR